MHTFTFKDAHIHILIHIHTHAHTHTQTCNTSRLACSHTHSHTHSQTYTHVLLMASPSCVFPTGPNIQSPPAQRCIQRPPPALACKRPRSGLPTLTGRLSACLWLCPPRRSFDFAAAYLSVCARVSLPPVPMTSSPSLSPAGVYTSCCCASRYRYVGS